MHPAPHFPPKDILKILMMYPSKQAYHSSTVRERPTGGTEKAVVFLGEAFQALGHTVQWVTLPEEIETSLSFHPHIVITQYAQYFEVFPQAYHVWWTHLFSHQTVIQNHVVAAHRYSDQAVTLSKAHQQEYVNNINMESVPIGHGVPFTELAAPCPKIPGKMIYCAAPDRGLELIPQLFSQLKALHPHLTLSICSSMKTYLKPELDSEFQSLFSTLSSMEGISVLGALNQPDLFQEMASAQYFLYPCTMAETYSIALDEALAHGCEPLVMELDPMAGIQQGAMSERIRTYSIEELLNREFATPPPLSTSFTNGASPFMRPNHALKSWLDIAKSWEELVFSKAYASLSFR
jgi:hypothetical protein